jgi:hypothetical protein
MNPATSGAWAICLTDRPACAFGGHLGATAFGDRACLPLRNTRPQPFAIAEVAGGVSTAGLGALPRAHRSINEFSTA